MVKLLADERENKRTGNRADRKQVSSGSVGIRRAWICGCRGIPKQGIYDGSAERIFGLAVSVSILQRCEAFYFREKYSFGESGRTLRVLLSVCKKRF